MDLLPTPITTNAPHLRGVPAVAAMADGGRVPTGPPPPTRPTAGPTFSPDHVTVQMAKEPESGVEVVQIVSKQTGAIIASLPPAQVLRVIADLIALDRKRGAVHE